MPESEGRFDAIVVGTGFAGAVTACRLAQAARRICVLERGRRYDASDFPIYPSAPRPPEAGECDARDYQAPDLTRALWRMGHGLWDVRSLGDVVVAQAAGFGGGSLIYANVHLRAPTEVFDEAFWPPGYTREQLDPYYDLAAYMLDVSPLPSDVDLPKTRELARAATRLGRSDRWFRVPLAVKFSAGGENRFERAQDACDMGGDCCFGCPRQAKNSLDLNYLAVAEDARDACGAPLAEVRTLCEAIEIRQQDGLNGRLYEVEYLDHLIGAGVGSQRVCAPAVFLCAGAIGSTELLLRSPTLSRDERSRNHLGTRYFPNADALAAVFDCERPQEIDRGPTITSALLHDEGPARPWLLFQDGGMPAALEPLLGFFRSPLWLGRNRYRHAIRGGSDLQRTAYAPLPFESVADVFSGFTGSAIRPHLARLHAVGRSLLSLAHGQPEAWATGATLRHWKVMPNQLRDALAEVRAGFVGAAGVAAEPIVAEFLDAAGDLVEPNLESDEGLLRQFPLPGLTTKGIESIHLSRRILTLGVQLVWGNEAGLARSVVSRLLDLLLPEPASLVERASQLLQWALDYRLGDGHTALLLSMGRDSRGGRLSLTGAGDPPPASDGAKNSAPCDEDFLSFRSDALRGAAASSTTPLPRRPAQMLRAELPDPLETCERNAQDQILRDIAAVWRGELRTDPLWAFPRRRVTVHSQGGCSMGAEPQASVTAPNGEVWGCPGLYVMDAAAFPTSVGVNPSATVLAIAELKIERFIREKPGFATWKAPERQAGEEWARGRIAQLDPLRGASSRDGAYSAQPVHRPVGIRFRERMCGSHRPVGATGAEAYIETNLDAEIADLTRFLERHHARKPEPIPVTGTVTIGGVTEIPQTPLRVDASSELRLFLRGGNTPGRPETRFIDYELVFSAPGPEGREWTLMGRKTIRHDARLDLWEDTTTLKFELWRGRSGPPVRRGVLRQSAADFFGLQIPSFEATHVDDDPLRQSWALTAFGQFFFGHLVDVYVPELNRFVDVLRSVAERTHG